MNKECSFCGRSDRDVRLLITGLNGYICEDCAEQAYRIVQENLNAPGSKKKKTKGLDEKKIPKPREIKDYLDDASNAKSKADWARHEAEKAKRDLENANLEIDRLKAQLASVLDQISGV